MLSLGSVVGNDSEPNTALCPVQPDNNAILVFVCSVVATDILDFSAHNYWNDKIKMLIFF